MCVLHEMNEQLAKENARLLVAVSKSHAAAHCDAQSGTHGVLKKGEDSEFSELIVSLFGCVDIFCLSNERIIFQYLISNYARK